MAGGKPPRRSAASLRRRPSCWRTSGSRPRLRDQIIRNYEEEGEPDGLFAVESYRKRAQEGRLPKPIDPLHRIADFSEDGYGAMRFTL